MSCAHFRHKKLHYTINGKPLERKFTGYGNLFTVFIVHTIYAHFASLRFWLFGSPWGPEGGENIGKPFYFNLPPDIGFTLFTPIKGRIDSLTVYIYQAETCTNILKYNTCMSSYPGDRNWTTIEP